MGLFTLGVCPYLVFVLINLANSKDVLYLFVSSTVTFQTTLASINTLVVPT